MIAYSKCSDHRISDPHMYIAKVFLSPWHMPSLQFNTHLTPTPHTKHQSPTFSTLYTSGAQPVFGAAWCLAEFDSNVLIGWKGWKGWKGCKDGVWHWLTDCFAGLILCSLGWSVYFWIDWLVADCLDWWVYVNSKFSFILKCRIAGPNRKATSCHTSSSQILHTKCPLQQAVFTPESCKPKGFLDGKPFASVYTKILIHDLDISSTWLWHDWEVKQTCEIWLGDDGDMTRTLGHHQNKLRHERDMTGTWQIHDQDITGTRQHHGETTCRRRGTLPNDSISYLAIATTKRRPLRPWGP